MRGSKGKKRPDRHQWEKGCGNLKRGVENGGNSSHKGRKGSDWAKKLNGKEGATKVKLTVLSKRSGNKTEAKGTVGGADRGRRDFTRSQFHQEQLFRTPELL